MRRRRDPEQLAKIERISVYFPGFDHKLEHQKLLKHRRYRHIWHSMKPVEAVQCTSGSCSKEINENGYNPPMGGMHLKDLHCRVEINKSKKVTLEVTDDTPMCEYKVLRGQAMSTEGIARENVDMEVNSWS